MCKFHKTVAREVATDPITKTFDPARYAVALVALSAFRIEQTMPGMFGCDGYNKYEMATKTAVQSMAQSGLIRHPGSENGDYVVLRAAMDNTAKSHPVSVAGLNLPRDPVRDVRFLDEATVELYTGYSAPGYARDLLTLKDRAHAEKFEPIRAAAAHFMAQPGVMDALHRRFDTVMIDIFEDAKRAASPTITKFYDHLPRGLRDAFKSCAMCVRDGAGGAAISHIGCVAVPAIAAASGTAISGAAMAGAMMVTSPLIAAGATYAIDRARGQKPSAVRMGGSAAFALAVAMAVSALGGHGGHTASDQGGHHKHHMKMTAQDIVNMNKNNICGDGIKPVKGP